MRQTETGIVLAGSQELHHARVGARILREEDTITYLENVKRGVKDRLFVDAGANVAEEELDRVRNVASALGERHPRDEDILYDAVSGEVLAALRNADFPIEGEYAAVVVNGLRRMQGCGRFAHMLRGTKRSVVSDMLEEAGIK